MVFISLAKIDKIEYKTVQATVITRTEIPEHTEEVPVYYNPIHTYIYQSEVIPAQYNCKIQYKDIVKSIDDYEFYKNHRVGDKVTVTLKIEYKNNKIFSEQLALIKNIK